MVIQSVQTACCMLIFTCRGVYITHSILVDLGRYQVDVHAPCGRMWISIFLYIVNYDFAQTFTSSVTGKGAVSKFLMRNYCNLKKLGRKNFNFFQFSRKRCRTFAFCLCSFTEIGALRNGWKNSGISLKLFHQRAPNVFIWVFLKVHWRFSRDHMGAPLNAIR